MFSGIVKETGKILHFTEAKESWKLTVAAQNVQSSLSLGDSLAVNGCCLTAITYDTSTVTFDLLSETVRLTSFSTLKPGAPVNLEASLSVNGRVGGHFVTGHIDAMGRVTLFERRGKDHYLRVVPPSKFLRYVIPKGSIVIDGVSLTVTEVDESSFAVWLIPHTLAITNLKERQPGDFVNLEFDLLAKYVEKLLPPNLRKE